MYDKPMLGLDQAQNAIAAILAEANKEPDRPLAISIVDDTGSIISYARMDRCREVPKRMATRKAYTARCPDRTPRTMPSVWLARTAPWPRWETPCWPPFKAEWSSSIPEAAPSWAVSA